MSLNLLLRYKITKTRKKDKIMELFTMPEIAERLGVHYLRVYYLINTKQVTPVIKKPKISLFTESQVEEIKKLLEKN